MGTTSVVQCKLAVQYQPYSAQLFSDELGAYKTYGLRIHYPETQTWGREIADVSCCLELVTQMAEVLNRMQVEPAHFEAVVYDFLSYPETVTQI